MFEGRLAVGELRAIKGDANGCGGTAFVVSPTRALTAFHCVGDRRTGELKHEKVAISFGDSDVQARVVRFNRVLDVALLEVADPLPKGLRPVPLALGLARHDRFSAMGWPISRPFINDASFMSGLIVESQATIFDGVSAIQLYCEQAADGTKLAGYSGAPILVRTSGGQAAVGIIRCSPDSEAQDGTADGGTVYGASVSSIIDAWSELGVCLLDVTPVASADCAVSYSTSEFDVSWGLWIAQTLDDDSRCVFTRDWYLRPGDFYVNTLQAGLANVRQIFVVISTASLRDDSDLYLAESRIVRKHEFARRIPVLLDDIDIPDYLQTRHPLRLYEVLDQEEPCRRSLLGALSPPGRPVANRPFPRRGNEVDQPATWQDGRLDDLGRRDD